MKYWWIALLILIIAFFYGCRSGILVLPTKSFGCDPCFPQNPEMSYRGHDADNLFFMVGSFDINNTRAIVGGTAVNPVGGPAFSHGSIVTYKSPGLFLGDIDVTVEYMRVDTGLYHNMTGKLHGKIGNLTCSNLF